MSQQINLFNPVFLAQRKYFSTVTMLQALAGIFAGVLAIVAYSSFQLQALGREAVASKANLEQTKVNLERFKVMSGPRQKSQALDEEIRRTESEIAGLRKITQIMQSSDFGSAKGYAEHFRALSRQIDDGIWLTSFDVQGSGARINLQGRALRPEMVPAFLSRLKNEPVLKGASFAVLEMSVPSEKPAAENTPGEKRRPGPEYVEFTLQSQGLAKGAPDAKGQVLR